jgi:hypothetical protein
MATCGSTGRPLSRPPSPDSLCSTARPTLADGGRPSWSRGHGVPGSHGPGPGACPEKVNKILTPTMSAAPKPGYRSFLLNLCLTSSRTVANARRPSWRRGHEVPGSHGPGPRACTVKVNRTLTPTTNRAAALGRCSSFVIDPIRKQCDRARLHPSFCPGPGSTPPVVLGLDPRTHGVPRPAASPGRCAKPKRLAVSLDLTDKMGPRVKPEDDGFFSSLRRSATLTRSPVIMFAEQSSNLCLPSSRTVANARRPSWRRGHGVPGSHGPGSGACTGRVNEGLMPTTRAAAEVAVANRGRTR